jgi:hypothetical protein
VLSTPPAFVLSQDQTLQQKPEEKDPATKSPNQNPDGGSKQQNWHWLSRHPVEFSKNNHTHVNQHRWFRWEFGRPFCMSPGALPKFYATR